ncbi:MAG: hypothetical protein SW833_23330 [Cyanobacteriota bacterium]|nr:hypothetical protein [Cyanobacteriota bacterium]
MKSTTQFTHTFSLLLLAIAIALPPKVRAQTLTRDRLLPLPQEIQRALIYNSSQDFFRQGRERFEQEIQELKDRKSAQLEIQYELPEREQPGDEEFLRWE